MYISLVQSVYLFLYEALLFREGVMLFLLVCWCGGWFLILVYKVKTTKKE